MQQTTPPTTSGKTTMPLTLDDRPQWVIDVANKVNLNKWNIRASMFSVRSVLLLGHVLADYLPVLKQKKFAGFCNTLVLLDKVVREGFIDAMYIYRNSGVM